MRFIFTFFAFCPVYIFSQTTVKGVVSDGQTGVPLPYVTVMVLNGSLGVNADENGRYEIKMPEDADTLVFSGMGYTAVSKKVEEHGGEVILNVRLFEEATQLSNIDVVAQADKTSQGALLEERKQSTVMVQKVGATRLSSIGASNVGEGLLKVTGVSKSDAGSGSVFVRGLGDRYNNVTLNGFIIPSTDPDMKNPPLDIFPTDIISNLTVSKAYSSNFLGDFAGANIDIVTGSFSEDKNLSIAVGSGGNSQSFLQPLGSYQGGNLDYLGYDNARALPSGGISGSNTQGWSRLNNNFSRKTMTGLPQLDLDLSYNQRFKGKKVNIEIGLNSGFSNKYQMQDYAARAFQTSGAPISSYDGVISGYKTQLTNLAQLFFDFKDKGRLRYNNLYVNDSKDESRIYGGDVTTGDLDGLELQNVFQEFRQSGINSSQLLYALNLSGRQSIEIGGAYTLTTNRMPDRRNIKIYRQNDQTMPYYLFNTIGGNPGLTRYFSDMRDNDWMAQAKYTYKISEAENYKSTLSAGYLFHGKNRSQGFSLIQAFTNSINRQIGTNSDIQYTSPALFFSNLDIFLKDAYERGGLTDIRNTAQTRAQNFRLYTHGFFANADFSFKNRFFLTAGLRYEQVDLTTNYDVSGVQRYGGIKTQNFLPALNAKYLLNREGSQALKISLSKTYSLPQFRELSAISYYTEIGETIGNPGLKQADIYNADVGWEYYPHKGGLISLTAFYKKIQNPIENLFISQSGTLTTSVINSRAADVYGLEAEWEESLSNYTSIGALQPLKIALNVSLLQAYAATPQTIRHEGLGGVSVIVYETNHALQGTTPVLLNIDAIYDFKKIKSKAALSYNFTDKTIDQVGSWNGSVVRAPISTLNFKWTTEFSKSLRLSLSCKNILNPVYDYSQQIKDTGGYKSVNAYTRGLDFSISLIYDLMKR